MKPDSHRLFLIDLLAIVLISVAICLWTRQLLLMSVLVPLVIALRMLAVFAVAKRESVNLKAELLFFIVCTILGAFNDWNSVCNKKIYDYTTGATWFDFTTIPLWMLLYWGMILRFVARLARWQALAPDETASDKIGLGGLIIENGKLKVALQLALVFITRSFIYKNYLDPLWSWLPFLVALIVLLLLFSPNRHDLKLLAFFALAGPLIEILYIQVGGLHYYHLGWLGGVPLWIALWWLIIVLIWKDLAFRVEKALLGLTS